MAFTSAPLRGNLYPSQFVQRCLEYKRCEACSMCTQFDPHAATCEYCESRKPAGPAHHCSCSQKRRDTARQMEVHFHRPFIPLPGVKYKELDQQIPLDPTAEALYSNIKSEFHKKS